MATDAQIHANRQNARKSTGPRTPHGKANARQNSLKHGLTARQDVITAEDQAQFDQYRDQILDELNPLTRMESMLANRIVGLSWRLKRAVSIQNQAIDAMLKPKHSLLPKIALPGQPQPDPPDPALALGRAAIKDLSNSRVLERLLMYERRTENSLYKTVLELQRLNLIRSFAPTKTLHPLPDPGNLKTRNPKSQITNLSPAQARDHKSRSCPKLP